MRSMLVGVAAVLALAVAGGTPVAAQVAVSSPVRFGVTGGLTVPTGSLSDYSGTGWNAGALVDVGFPLLPLGFRVDAMWQQLPGKLASDGLSTATRFIDGTLNATYSFGGLSAVNFYFIGGLGVYNVRMEARQTTYPPAGAFTQTTTSSETRFGLNGGAGVRFRLSGMSTFIEARWHDVFTSGRSAQIVPVSVGIVF